MVFTTPGIIIGMQIKPAHFAQKCVIYIILISRISNLILCLVLKTSVLITAGILRADAVFRVGQIVLNGATSKQFEKKYPV